jgi:tetratricopeptide (TPR) repeat protein
MSDETTSPPIGEDVRSAITQAVQEWQQQGNTALAIQNLKPVAEATQHPALIALLAYLYTNAGQYREGLPIAEQALASGIGAGMIATNYANWAQTEPTFRPRVPEFVQTAIEGAWQIDPFGIAAQLVNQGDPDGAVRTLAQARVESPRDARARWTELLADVQAARGEIDGNVRVTEQARTEALRSIGDAEASIRREAERVRDLVHDAAVLIQGAGADQLASEYRTRANSARKAAARWTAATLVLGTLAIIFAAAFVLVGVSRNHDISDTLTKAAISIPVFGLAFYLGRIGAEERKDARTWRHVELQIRTAQPYLANLPEIIRDDVQASLALRFFPGQAQSPHGGTDSDTEPEDALRLIREIQQHQHRA